MEKETKTLHFTALLMAVYLSFVTYPGIFFTDTYSRCRFAIKIIETAKLGDLGIIDLHTNLSITPQIIMAFIYWLNENWGFLTLFQAYLYFFTILYICFNTVKKYRYLLSFAFCICPVILGYSVFQDTSVGCLIGVNGLFILLWIYPMKKKDWTLGQFIIYSLGILISAWVAMGYRLNAITTLPVFGMLIYLSYRKHKKKLIGIQLCMLITGCICVILFPKILNIHESSAIAVGMTWEILTTIEDLPEDEQEQFGNYLDYISGDGSTKRALALNRERSVNGWLWTEEGFPISSVSENSNRIIDDYFKLIITKPKAYWKTKLHFVEQTMGIGLPLENLEYSYNVNEEMSNYNFSDTKSRKNFVDMTNDFLNRWEIVRKPILGFIFGIIMLGILFFIEHKVFVTASLFYLLALFYYAAFLITNQSFEFRYYFIAFIYLALVNLCGISCLMELVSKKISKRILFTDKLVQDR